MVLSMRIPYRTFVISLFILAMSLLLGPATNAADSPEAILQRTRSAYTALSSYSDTGVVLSEYGTSSKDRHTFSTYFTRAPRHFVFDFHKQSGDRYVVWGDPDAFHTWWKTTGNQTDYPNPNNAPAINQSGYSTAQSISKLPALLYGKDALQGLLTNFVDTALDGTEEIGSRKCYRIVGRASDFYGTGKEVNIHKLTVWIDAESYLVREVREESKALPGQISRVTTTFEPQANPKIDDKHLQFAPPQPK
jgi:outer membrane lipoprotein-sorting protein